MYHSLAKHYVLGEFEGLSQSNPVTTLTGRRYAVNVTYDGGVIHVKSRWANATLVGSTYETVPMTVYEVDRVLLPDTIFRAHPPVVDTPPVPALPAPATEEDPPSATATEGHAHTHHHQAAAGVRSH
ncbi:hypothetical protein ABZP36_003646 [Zizania latifolia]